VDLDVHPLNVAQPVEVVRNESPSRDWAEPKHAVLFASDNVSGLLWAVLNAHGSSNVERGNVEERIFFIADIVVVVPRLVDILGGIAAVDHADDANSDPHSREQQAAYPVSWTAAAGRAIYELGGGQRTLYT